MKDSEVEASSPHDIESGDESDNESLIMNSSLNLRPKIFLLVGLYVGVYGGT